MHYLVLFAPFAPHPTVLAAIPTGSSSLASHVDLVNPLVYPLLVTTTTPSP